MFTGSSRVGKTSLKYNLLHNKPRKVKLSTPVLEAPEVAMISEAYVRGGSVLWTEAKDEFLGEMFSHAEIKSKKSYQL